MDVKEHRSIFLFLKNTGRGLAGSRTSEKKAKEKKNKSAFLHHERELSTFKQLILFNSGSRRWMR